MSALGDPSAFLRRAGTPQDGAATVPRGSAAETQRLVVAGISFWAVQLLVFCLEFGFSTFRDVRPSLGGLLIGALSGVVLANANANRTAYRILLGATVGLGMSCVQLVSLGSFLQAPWGLVSHGIVWCAVALAAGALTGAALCWAEPTLIRGWGKALAFLLAGSSFATIHVAIVRSIPDVPVPSGGMILPMAIVFVAALAFITGLTLRDSGRLASASAIARRERFRLLAEALPIPVLVTNDDHSNIIFSNRRSKEQFSVKRSVSAPGSKDDALSIADLYANPQEHKRLAEILSREGVVENYEVQMRRADGSAFWALVSAQIVDFTGQSAIVAAYYDISDRKAAEAALLASEVRYALISRASHDGIFDWDLNDGTVYYSERWKEIVGIDGKRRLNTIEDWISRVHPDDIGRLKHEIKEHREGRLRQLDTEYRMLNGEGLYSWMQCRALILRNAAGEPIRMAGSQADITLRKTYEQNLLNAAYEDRLTGLSNRAHFSHHIEQYETADSIAGCAILLFNVDEFRRLNDNLGNGAGDTLLTAMGRRLRARLQPGRKLARLGGDEFAFWIEDISSAETCRLFADMMLAELEQPYTLGDIEVPVKVSAGAASNALGEATCGTDLLRNARLALDRSKHSGGGRLTLFDDELLRETQHRRRLSKDLIVAEKQQQINFVYQPIIDLSGGIRTDISGFELLMRWEHPELGAIGPAQFIPIAEEAGLIGPLGLFAIENAAQEIRKWSQSRYMAPDFSVSVNLSARQISDRAGILRLLTLLDRLDLPSGRLKLEITESVMMSDPETMIRTLQQIRERGVELCLDDFGTGYSSLNYLHRFPLDVLKIDRSFVSRMANAPEAYRLVKSIVELAHDLGLKTVAEGVESLVEVELLRGLGCNFGQGYYFSRPLSAADAEILLLGEAA